MDEIPKSDDLRIERTVLRALEKLPEFYRVPVYLHIVEEYTVMETARILGMKFGTAASAIHRGRKMLQAAFREEEM